MFLTRRSSRLAARCGMAISLFCGAAMADLPAVFDRVPADAQIVLAVRDGAALQEKIKSFAAAAGWALEGSPLDQVTAALALDGVKKDGSLGMVITPPKAAEGAESSDESLVMLVPVTDANALIKALGGEPGEGVREVKGMPGDEEGGPVFAKDIGDGYVAISQNKEIAEAFAGAKDGKKAHEANTGVAGKRISENADVMLVANLDLLRDSLNTGIGEFAEGAEQNMAMFGGEGAGKQIEIATMVAKTFVRDAQSGVVGVQLKESGAVLDFGAQFKEGSELAGFFQVNGDSGALTGHMPNMAFMFAMAIDTTTPGMKKILKGAAELNANDPGAAATYKHLFDRAETIDGYGFVLGTSPGLFAGGLFANALQYIVSSDAPGFIEAYQKSLAEMNGKEIQGVSYTTKYDAAAVDVSGTKFDRWSVQTQVDPNHPAAMQVQQAQMMMFGPGAGPSGLVATADKHIIMTMSQNSTLAGQALTAAKEGNGLTNEDGVKGAASILQKNRTIEGYIGTKSIMDLAVSMMSMMGAGAEITVPDSLPPIALGGTTDAGAVHLRVHVPVEVIKTVKGAVESMQGGEEPMEEPAPKEGGAPRF